MLAEDMAAWEAIRPRMNASSDAQFEQLRSDWLAGVPARGPVDGEAAGKLLTLMGELGGADLVGKAQSLPDGLFAEVE